MNFWSIAIPTYAIVIILGGLIVLFLHFFFHWKYSERIIKLLDESGFDDLSYMIKSVIETTGKFQQRGYSYSSKRHYSVWKRFRTANLKNGNKELMNLQRFYRINTLLMKILLIIFFIPFLIIILFVITK